MKTITVDQFLGTSWVDVYVKDENSNELLEIEQGLKMDEAYTAINKHKNEYGITEGVFNLYNGNEVQIESNKVTL